MRTLIRHGYLVQVRRGVYATRGAIASAKNDPCRAHALQVAAVRVWLGRDVVGSHHSAALVHGFDLLKRPPDGAVTVTRQPPRTRRNRDTTRVLFHIAELPETHVTREHGTSVTTAARTVIDLARTSSFIEAVVAADSALRMRKTTKEELLAVCDRCGRWPGSSRARRVVSFSNGRAESVLESCARVMFAEHDLEAPEVQVTIRGPGYLFRVDFCWEEQKTIAEADGLAKYSGGEDMLAQFRRDRLLRDAGYKVVHFTWRELFESPETVIDRIRKALAAPTSY
jgi:very-short-patch-repair endonuclease